MNCCNNCEEWGRGCDYCHTLHCLSENEELKPSSHKIKVTFIEDYNKHDNISVYYDNIDCVPDVRDIISVTLDYVNEPTRYYEVLERYLDIDKNTAIIIVSTTRRALKCR